MALRLMLALSGLVSGGGPSAAQPAGCLEPLVPGSADETCEAASRQGDQVPDLSALKTPESPAFMALGLAPSEIQRPTTPTGLALALATGLARGTNILPGNDFALEVSPYWLVQHPRLTAQDLEQERWRSVYRNISLSAAVTTRKVDLPIGGGQTMPTDMQQAALGVRTTLGQGRLSEAALACRGAIAAFTAGDVWAEANAERKFLEGWTAKDPKPPPPVDPGDAPKPDGLSLQEFERRNKEYLARKAKANDGYRAQLDWLERRRQAIAAWRESFEPKLPEPTQALVDCLDDIHHRVGLMAEVAGALTATSPAGDLSKIDGAGGQSQTAWFTLGYVFGTHVGVLQRALDVSALGVARLQHETLAMQPQALRLDAGLRLVLAWERYGLSGEALVRDERLTSAADHARWRAALTVDYRFAGGTWVTVTFGKDFGTDATPAPVLALGNLQWNFGRERTLRPDTTLTRPASSGGGP